MHPYILIAEDDADDRFLLEAAWEDANIDTSIKFVNNGVELMALLKATEQKPSLILMDLNMPLKNGREVLKELRSSPALNPIPVIITSTSKAPFDVQSSYDCGANAYIVKPSTFSELIALFKSIEAFWVRYVKY